MFKKLITALLLLSVVTMAGDGTSKESPMTALLLLGQGDQVGDAGY